MDQVVKTPITSALSPQDSAYKARHEAMHALFGNNQQPSPYHQHDCDVCEYLGSTVSPGEPIDWYVCNDAVIGRHSSEGSDYWSTDRQNIESGYLGVQYEGRTATRGMMVLARHMLNSHRHNELLAMLEHLVKAEPGSEPWQDAEDLIAKYQSK